MKKHHLQINKPRSKTIGSGSLGIYLSYSKIDKKAYIDYLELDFDEMVEVHKFLVKSIKYAQEVKRCEDLNKESKPRPIICSSDLTHLNIKLD